MADTPTRGAGGWSRRVELKIIRSLVALLLAAGWVGIELYTVRTHAAARMADAASSVRANVGDLLNRFSVTTAAFTGADTSTGDRIAVAARLLHLERDLAPAQSLFLYNAEGRFVAATLPLLPGDEDVSHHAWFGAAAGRPRFRAITLTAEATAPLGQGKGVVITRTLADYAGRFAGVIGTFLDLSTFRTLLDPAGLPPGSVVRLTREGAAAPLLAFSEGKAEPHPFLDSLLSWTGGAPTVAARLRLPGGLVWHAAANAFSEVPAAERRAVFLRSVLIATGLLPLLWFPRGARSRPPAKMADFGPAGPTPDPDWVWEIDARGRLVGVAGNAPEPLIAAVGTNFLDLLAADPRSEDLRDAIAGRAPVHDLELAFVLPGTPPGTPRRFRLNGRAVQNTGGFWGTAGEVPDLTESAADAAD